MPRYLTVTSVGLGGDIVEEMRCPHHSGQHMTVSRVTRQVLRLHPPSSDDDDLISKFCLKWKEHIYFYAMLMCNYQLYISSVIVHCVHLLICIQFVSKLII